MKAEHLELLQVLLKREMDNLRRYQEAHEGQLNPEELDSLYSDIDTRRSALVAINELPPTPGDLDARLSEAITTENAVGIYKHALSMAKRYEAVKKSAVAVARAAIEPGIRKVVTTFGNCGWTQPKRKVLDKHAWLQAIADDDKLAHAQDAFDAARFALDEAQAPYMVDVEPRFYIR